MGFSQALSGLNASSSNLNVIGNNIANSQTVGFKSSNAVFADVFAGAKIGAGVSLSSVVQNFSAGNVEGTGRALDLAISGEGFFKLNQGGQVVYSRNGQLTLTPDGYLENAQGARLMANEGVIRVPSAAMQASATTKVGSVFNLKGGDTLPDANKPFDPADSSTFNYASTASVYDSLGSVHQLTTYFRKVGTASSNTWELHATVDGKSVTPKPAPLLSFDSNGKLIGTNDRGLIAQDPAQAATLAAGEPDATDTALYPLGAADPAYLSAKSAYDAAVNDKAGYDAFLLGSAPDLAGYVGGAANPDYLAAKSAYDTYSTQYFALPQTTEPYRPAQFQLAKDVLGNGADDLTFEFDVAGTTQFGNDYDQSSLTQNGYTAGSLVGITIDQNGTIVGNYSNEQKQTVGALILATFRTPEGLESVGNNVWIETAASGQPLFGTAGIGRFGTVESGALEVSNVDMTKELVNLIVAQRTFQANAQSVKAQSDMLEQAVNLR